MPTDATCALAGPDVSPPGPDVIVNVNADSTASFAAWAMGSAAPADSAPALDKLAGGAGGAGALAGLPGGSLLGAPSDAQGGGVPGGGAAPPAAGMTPSREVTPQLRRRSARVSAVAVSTVQASALYGAESFLACQCLRAGCNGQLSMPEH